MDLAQRIVSAQEGVVGQGEAEGVAIAFVNSPIEGFNLTVSFPFLLGFEGFWCRRGRGRWKG
jgi:hypothetical protein